MTLEINIDEEYETLEIIDAKAGKKLLLSDYESISGVHYSYSAGDMAQIVIHHHGTQQSFVCTSKTDADMIYDTIKELMQPPIDDCDDDEEGEL